MAPSDNHDCDASRIRMQTGEFTTFTRFVHPSIDAVVPIEDIDLVPRELRPRGGLKWKVAPGHAKMQDDLEGRICTDDLITSFRADLDHMHGKVSQLESLIKSFLGSSLCVSSDPVSERRFDENVGSTALPNSPAFESVSLCSIADQDCCSIKGNAGQIEPDGASCSGRVADRPLRKRRSFGPYELFWMQNNPYSAARDVANVSGDTIRRNNDEDQAESK